MPAGVGAVLPAAGQGARFGGRVAKTLARLAGEPLVVHALRALERSRLIDCVVLAVRDGDQASMRRLVARARLKKVAAVVAGGAARADSVANAVAALPESIEWVVVHDAARPCLTPSLVDEVVRGAQRVGAAASGLPAWLTVKAVDEARRVRLTLDRENLWFIQTPQAFRRAWWRQALAAHQQSQPAAGLSAFPDDVALLEWAGFPVEMVPGDPWNLKVTTREDLVLADAILRAQRARR